ncbi:MAG: cysteine--tRNA ligase [Dethiobacteria bacterium]|jgi:cysteinyl-tRNA synthetase|nr:cysteine--tRNA ligase [Bacillota bacterium]
MTIRLYNTLTRKKEVLKPGRNGRIGIYACGPTVYDYFHIGNARVFIIFDLIRRYLKYRGYQVAYVQNFTDIDDKMIRRAHELGISVEELAERFIKAYNEDAQALGVQPADHHPRATRHIPSIIKLIERLIANGLAYEVDGEVYYDTVKFKDYGKLSHQRLEELEAGARIEVDPRKRNPLDFVLWKKQKPGEPAWASPWGKGRPGWHIECSAMAMHYLGETIDIHGGGPDLIFPHHENEIAQSEGATGKPFVRYWLHVGYLNIDKQKMSKSLGNFLTVRELRRSYDPKVLRFFMLSAHYRNPINFSEEQLQQSRSSLERLNLLLFNVHNRLQHVTLQAGNDDQKMLAKIAETREKFIQAMDDDFNSADALSHLFTLAWEANIYLDHTTVQGKKVLETLLNFYREIDSVLGILTFQEHEVQGEGEEEIERLLAERESARKNRDFAKADRIRDQLQKRGIVVEDTPHGPRWRYER